MEPHRQQPELDSFYHLAPPDTGATLCRGTACFVARHLDAARWIRACAQTPRVYCLGKCYLAPASVADDGRPHVEVRSRRAVVLRNVAAGGVATLDEYTRCEGYRALEAVLRRRPEDVVSAVESSELRGRGGAGFPAGRKWRAVAAERAEVKYVVANADEGDAGAYIDRFIMEDDPHCLLEAMTIAAYAVGARAGYIYLRKEYPHAHAVLKQALSEARGAGLLGERILDSDFSFNVELVSGQGSYLCGEETAMLNAIEGVRPEVRTRPPYPTQHGLYGRPTLVNNVETLAGVPWIVLHGAGAYRALGFSHSRGTKVVSLNSLFQRPGLYEIEFGMTVREIVEDLGGGLRAGELKGVVIGGPLAGIIPPHLLDTAFGYQELEAIGAGVGHGGVIAFDRHTSIVELVQHVFSFGAYESCGKCTPCRLGTARIERIFADVAARGRVPLSAKAEWENIITALAETNFCGHGTGLAQFAASALRHYGEELHACFA